MKSGTDTIIIYKRQQMFSLKQMYVLNVTDYDYITSFVYTDYDNRTLSNCTNIENNIHMIIPT